MNIVEAKKIIETADICGDVPLLKGIHGIGKTEAVVEHSRENDMHFEPLLLSLMDTGDMLGMPDTQDVSGMKSTVWSAPSWYSNIVNAAWAQYLPLDRLQFTHNGFQAHVLKAITNGVITRQELNSLYCEFFKVPNDRLQLLRQEHVNYLDARRSLLFLDEFNRAPADILNASLQLINEHRLHSHILPIVRGQETLIVAAINPADGDYTVQELDPALLDRFVDCEVTPDFPTWLKWAKNKGINQIVIDFLMDNQTKFHFVPKDGSKGASPRSWVKLGRYLDRIENTPKSVMTYYFKGLIGSALASQFLSFYNNYSNNITVKSLDDMIKVAIKEDKDNGIELNPEKLAETITDVVSNLEIVRRADFATAFVKKYIDKDSAEKAMPLLVYLYSLPLENLAGVLKSIQTDDINNYAQLAILDKEANNKRLFLKLTSYTTK